MRCALCHHAFASGLEPAATSDLFRARKLLGQFGQESEERNALVCVFCAQFVQQSQKDLKKLDERRHVLFAQSAAMLHRPTSVVIKHHSRMHEDTDVSELRCLPNEMNRVLSIRPITSESKRTGGNLMRQHQRETIAITQAERKANQFYYETRIKELKNESTRNDVCSEKDRLLLLGPKPRKPTNVKLYRGKSPPVHHVNAGVLVQSTAGRFRKLQVHFPAYS